MSSDLREREDRLRAYVEEAKGRPMQWGFDDCSPWAAQWVADITGKELGWPIYSTEEEARRIIEEGGGLPAIWRRMARDLGLEEVVGEQPRLGDVGIIESSRGQVGGIFAHGGAFCWRAEQGVRVIGVWGRTYPVRVAGDIEHRPVVVGVWRV